MSGQVWRGSAGEYQADERAGAIFALVAYAFGVTYIKSLLRPMFTTSPGCFLLAHL